MGRGENDNEEQLLREEAASDAFGDLASAYASGDVEGVQASLAQAKQIAQGIDLVAMRERVHVPKQAGEWAEGLVAIMNRIPDGWGRWISCDKGWYPLLVELDQAIAAIDPDYEIHQVKEKYGELCYYFHTSGNGPAGAYEQIDKLVDQAEARAAVTCEECGQPGSLHMTKEPSAWLKTLCPDCAAAHPRATYLSEAAWKAWWAEEKPRYQAEQKRRFIERMQGKRVLIAADDRALDQLTFTATVVRLPEEALRLTEGEWDEIWIGSGSAAEACVRALAERYRGHFEAQEEAKEKHFAEARAAGKHLLGFVLQPPDGAPVLTWIGSERVSSEPLSGYGFRSGWADPKHYLA